jgi:hypothetical protein
MRLRFLRSRVGDLSREVEDLRRERDQIEHVAEAFYLAGQEDQPGGQVRHLEPRQPEDPGGPERRLRLVASDGEATGAPRRSPPRPAGPRRRRKAGIIATGASAALLSAAAAGTGAVLWVEDESPPAARPPLHLPHSPLSSGSPPPHSRRPAPASPRPHEIPAVLPSPAAHPSAATSRPARGTGVSQSPPPASPAASSPPPSPSPSPCMTVVKISVCLTPRQAG